jgi:hypothetical protein
VSFDAGLPKPSSRILALIALVLWAYSFSLTAIVTLYATGTLEMMPAWMANPLLLWIGILVLLGRSGARYAPLMVLCVFGTPFIWTLTGDAGGIPFRDIVGYGWGAVLWTMSVTLMAAAAGTSELEIAARPTVPRRPTQDARDRRGDDEEWELPSNKLINLLPNYLRDPQCWGRPLRLAGLVLTILAFAVSLANAIYGRIDADCARIHARGVAFYHDCSMLKTSPCGSRM